MLAVLKIVTGRPNRSVPMITRRAPDAHTYLGTLSGPNSESVRSTARICVTTLSPCSVSARSTGSPLPMIAPFITDPFTCVNMRRSDHSTPSPSQGTPLFRHHTKHKERTKSGPLSTRPQDVATSANQYHGFLVPPCAGHSPVPVLSEAPGAHQGRALLLLPPVGLHAPGAHVQARRAVL